MFNFDFLEKGLAIVPPPHSMLRILYYIPVNMPLGTESLDNMRVAIVFLPVCDAINFAINCIFLIKTKPKSQDKN